MTPRNLLRTASPTAGFILVTAWLTWLSCQRSVTNDRCDYFARRLREVRKELEAIRRDNSPDRT